MFLFQGNSWVEWNFSFSLCGISVVVALAYIPPNNTEMKPELQLQVQYYAHSSIFLRHFVFRERMDEGLMMMMMCVCACNHARVHLYTCLC